jgi:hypothetical protein
MGGLNLQEMFWVSTWVSIIGFASVIVAVIVTRNKK